MEVNDRRSQPCSHIASRRPGRDPAVGDSLIPAGHVTAVRLPREQWNVPGWFCTEWNP